MRWLLLSIIVCATVLSDILQSHEMKRSGEQSVDARALGRLLRMTVSRRYLLLSILCLAVSFFAFMALVQIAPLSFAVPASAATFVLETALANAIARRPPASSRRTSGIRHVTSPKPVTSSTPKIQSPSFIAATCTAAPRGRWRPRDMPDACGHLIQFRSVDDPSVTGLNSRMAAILGSSRPSSRGA